MRQYHLRMIAQFFIDLFRDSRFSMTIAIPDAFFDISAFFVDLIMKRSSVFPVPDI
jgi:hypothetical protein